MFDFEIRVIIYRRLTTTRCVYVGQTRAMERWKMWFQSEPLKEQLEQLKEQLEQQLEQMELTEFRSSFLRQPSFSSLLSLKSSRVSRKTKTKPENTCIDHVFINFPSRAIYIQAISDNQTLFKERIVRTVENFWMRAFYKCTSCIMIC